MSHQTNELDNTLQVFFNSTPLLMGICEIEGSDIRHIVDNLAAARFFGRTPEQTSGKFASELGVPFDVIKKWIVHYEEAKVTGSPQKLEYLHEAHGKAHFLSATLTFLGKSKVGRSQFSYTVHDVTDFKEAEIKLVSSRDDFKKMLVNIDERLKLALAGANIGMYERDLMTNHIIWSDEAKHILGLSSERLEESFQFFMNRIHHKDREEFEREVLRKERSIKTTFRFFRPDNKMLWILSSAITLKDEAGRPIRTIGVVQDITEQRQNQEALKASEKRYRSLFENMTEEIHAWELLYHKNGSIKTWRLLDANPAALKTWDKKLEDIIGKTTDEIFGPGSTEHYLPVVQKIVNERHPYTYEDFFPSLNRHFRFTSFALGDIFFTTGTDITEIKKTLIKLRESEVINRTITENAASCLFMLDKDGHPTFMNPAAKRVTGYQDLDEIKNKPLHYAIHWKKADGTHYPKEECPIHNAQIGFKLIQNQEEVLCRKDGTLFPVSFSVAPLQKHDKLVGSVLEFRDITEEQKANEALKEALIARDEFLSIASHELKTPLTSLKLQVQLQTRLFKLGGPDAYSKEKIYQNNEKIEQYVNKLDRLINDILDISRIRTGKLTLVKAKVDLCIIAKEVVDRMQIAFKAAGADEIKFECSGKLTTLVDSMRIEQVLNNLIQNSLKYAKGKGVEVSIVNVRNVIRIKVTDQGVGISPEIQSKIFDRYIRGISASEVSGLGLGLFISQQIILAHEGTIWVESDIGKGASFYIEIPKKD